MEVSRENIEVSKKWLKKIIKISRKLHGKCFGKNILRVENARYTASNTTNINVQNLISGLYIVVVEVDGISVANTNLIVIH